MIKRHFVLMMICLTAASSIVAQPANIAAQFPEGTRFYQNIPYAGDTLKKHLLDIYLPKPTDQSAGKLPVVVWIHGGAWMVNDKYADMSYMKNTVRQFIEKGYALVSIDYRHSTTAIFPAQVQDCHAALNFIDAHAAEYQLDNKRIVLIGFSAGGHLANLLSLSLNNNVKDFYPSEKTPSYSLRGVIDFYGPVDLLMMEAKSDPKETTPITRLLGDAAIVRPDLARRASPAFYVDKDDPPFFIVQGEKDESVPYQQSVMLKAMLDHVSVRNRIIIVKDAPHYGPMFDSEEIRQGMFQFLQEIFSR